MSSRAVATEGATAQSIRWWQWPTVLSLDAPAVALGWQAMLARAGSVSLGWPHDVVLAASVWLAYVADRWIEGWRLTPASIRTERHAFHQRRRWLVAGAWLLVLVADVVVAVTRLSRRELNAGWLLLPAVLAYLLSHQLVHRHHPWRAPKEIVIALLLGAGAAVFPIANGGRWPLWPVLALFVAVAFANCALISRWEREVDRSHGQSSLALAYANDAWIRLLPWMLAAASLAVFVALRGEDRTAAACAATSAVLLAAVDRVHVRVGWRLARLLADLVLLTPFAVLPFGR